MITKTVRGFRIKRLNHLLIICSNPNIYEQICLYKVILLILSKASFFWQWQLSRHKKPTHMTLYWFPYTCGAIGFSLCSLWLLRHSSLMGSSDDYNLVRHAKESIARFWSDPAEPVRYLICVYFLSCVLYQCM